MGSSAWLNNCTLRDEVTGARSSQMHRLGIGIVATAVLIVLSIFCSASFAEGLGQALIEAAQKGDLAQVKTLLTTGADVNARDHDGRTALMFAAWNGNLEAMRLLIDKGADVHAKAKNGDTAFRMRRSRVTPES
jgi:ankyrin repeat protein